MNNIEDKNPELNKAREGSEGQNPLWPGEGIHHAGEVLKEKDRGNDIDEKTIIPLVQ